MAKHVCNGATLQCTMGMAPSTFIVTPENKMLTSNQPAANIMDHKPMKNIMPFGMCKSPANPQVAAATCGLAGLWHMPKGMMFFIGLWSMMFAAGWLLVSILFSGVTTRVLGAMPMVHCRVAPLQTCFAIDVSPGP